MRYLFVILLFSCAHPCPQPAYLSIPINLREPVQKKMESTNAGYYKCLPPSNVNVCVTNNDWKAQVFNKENMEYAHRELLKLIDDYNQTLINGLVRCPQGKDCKDRVGLSSTPK